MAHHDEAGHQESTEHHGFADRHRRASQRDGRLGDARREESLWPGNAIPARSMMSMRIPAPAIIMRCRQDYVRQTAVMSLDDVRRDGIDAGGERAVWYYHRGRVIVRCVFIFCVLWDYGISRLATWRKQDWQMIALWNGTCYIY